MIAKFHHSSFLAGQKVSFAGELQVVRGKLSVVTNKSGHYKPTEAHALVQLLYFHRMGVRLEDVTMKWVKGLNDFDEECAMVRTCAFALPAHTLPVSWAEGVA